MASTEESYPKGFQATTNNRMEIMAAIAGLRALKRACKVTLYTDSQYLARGIERGWANEWRANGWRKAKNGGPVRNADLWERLLNLCGGHDVEFVWTPGHAGNIENERCDEIARRAAQGAGLEEDTSYSDCRADQAG